MWASIASCSAIDVESVMDESGVVVGESCSAIDVESVMDESGVVVGESECTSISST